MTDVALEWMSFRRSGHTGSLTAEHIGDVNAYRFVNDMVTLGHAEWVGKNSWQIAPPLLAGIPFGEECTAVLCGARTGKLLDGLTQASSELGVRIRAQQHNGLPATFTVAASSQELLSAFALRTRIPFQMDAGIKILACTPSIREWPRTPFPMVEGRVDAVRRFSRSKIQWVNSTLAEAASASNGAFRIQRDWDWVSLIKTSTKTAALIDDRVGRMAAAVKLRVIRWNSENETLFLPAQLYPPSLMARGLALCSGALPSYDRDTKQIAFAGVRPEHLKLILALTGLRLA